LPLQIGIEERYRIIRRDESGTSAVGTKKGDVHVKEDRSQFREKLDHGQSMSICFGLAQLGGL
jgi:hypothetical protein